jgi:S-phase kinase-associated protein 1
MTDQAIRLDADELELETVTLQSKDAKHLVRRLAAQRSEYLANALTNPKDTHVDCTVIAGPTLSTVVQYLEALQNGFEPTQLPKPLPDANLQALLQPLEVDLIYNDRFTDELMFNLLLAANYLNIKPLLDLAAARVAAELKGRTPEQIRKRFGAPASPSREQEEEVRKRFQPYIEQLNW